MSSEDPDDYEDDEDQFEHVTVGSPVEVPISPKNESGLNSDIGMLSPKEEEITERGQSVEPPQALSSGMDEEGQNEMLSGDEQEEEEDEEYDDYPEDIEGPLTPLSHQIEESGGDQ